LAASISATVRRALDKRTGNDGEDADHDDKGDHEQGIDEQSQPLTKPRLFSFERSEREKVANDEKNSIRRQKVVIRGLRLGLNCN
jgi:hypothetical protein